MLFAAPHHAVASLALAAAIGTAGTAGLATPAFAHDGPGHHGHQAPAVFVQTDDPAGNTVVAYDRNPDGTLTQADSYGTGGLGGVLTGSAWHLVARRCMNGLLFAADAAGRVREAVSRG